MGELTAWQAGVNWSRADLPTAIVTDGTDTDLRKWLDVDAAAALTALGRPTFAYWFWRGWDDHQATLAH